MLELLSKLPVDYDRVDFDLDAMRLNIVDERYEKGIELILWL